MLVHGQELHAGDADALQVGDGSGVREAGIGASFVRRHLGMLHGEPLHMHLIDDGLLPGHGGQDIALPVERIGDHHRLEGDRAAVLEIPH